MILSYMALLKIWSFLFVIYITFLSQKWVGSTIQLWNLWVNKTVQGCHCENASVVVCMMQLLCSDLLFVFTFCAHCCHILNDEPSYY